MRLWTQTFLCILLGFLMHCQRLDQTQLPLAQKGVLDLRNHDFSQTPVIPLDGEWEFYWKEFIPPLKKQPSNNSTQYSPSFLTIPGRWNEFLHKDKEVGAKGYASYRLRILTNDKLQIPAIKLGRIGFAYELFINGHKVTSGGKIGRTEEQTIPGFNPGVYTILPYKKGNSQEWEIVFHISNYHEGYGGGIWYSCNFGENKAITKQDKQKGIFDFLLFGSILIMGLYHFGLYTFRNKEKAALWFGVICLLISLRVLITDEKYLEKLFPTQTKLFLFLEYLNMLLLTQAFLKFLFHLYQAEVYKRVYTTLWYTGYILIIPIVILPVFYYSNVLSLIEIYIIVSGLYTIYIMLKALKNKQQGAKLFFTGIFILFTIIVNDILYHQLWTSTTELLPLGLFIFILLQAASLSIRFSNALNRVEDLSINLEQKVHKRTQQLKKEKEETEKERQKSEKLLLNILPKDIVQELKEKGNSTPVSFSSATVLFTDFKGFTQIAENLSPQALVKELDACFVQFDKIIEYYHLEKLKTIGDSYMCAGGIPQKNNTHAIDAVLAAIEILNFMNLMKEMKEMKNFPYWEVRLGIHTGPLVAGIIGERKFAYDVWGDTVNIASRMESSGTSGKINISGATHELIKDFFVCEYRGKIGAKNKGEVDMYYVSQLKTSYSQKEKGQHPNEIFWQKYQQMQ
ncbi:MAG: adenylate/guanylate cyclase domain-containing protein [Spirochaetota bacterium]